MVIVTSVTASASPDTFAEVRVRFTNADTIPYLLGDCELIITLVFGELKAAIPNPESIIPENDMPRGRVRTQQGQDEHGRRPTMPCQPPQASECQSSPTACR